MELLIGTGASLKLYMLHLVRAEEFSLPSVRLHFINLLGNSQDHAYGFFKTPLAFTYEVRAGADPPSRYILPPDQIRPNVEEMLASLIAFVAKAKELGYFNV